LNFITPIPRQRIEDLANASHQSSMLHSGDLTSKPSINKVYDQYVNFVCVESDFFVLSGGGQGVNDDINFYGKHLQLSLPFIDDFNLFCQ